MIISIDQMGRSLHFEQSPQRIVSLVPSLTEWLYDVGVGDRVIACTKYCEVEDSTLVRIGGTKNPEVNQIGHLRPDLILANKEENQHTHVLELSSVAPVWTSVIDNLQTADVACLSIAKLLGVKEKAQSIVHANVSRLQSLKMKGEPKRVLYMIWRRPWMSVGGDTYIHDIITRLGMKNIMAEHPRYPILEEYELTALQVDVVWLSSEPYPFQTKHLKEMKMLFPNAKVEKVDGAFFSWYGSRLAKSTHYLWPENSADY